MSFDTPLRYPGGKGRLAIWLRDVLRANDLTRGTYIEPYAGGAGAAISLLVNRHVDRIHINDIDPAIYLFWKSVVERPRELASLVRNAEISVDTRQAAKNIIRNPSNYDETTIAFSTLLLNRTSRSGILSGGPIGGTLQKGKYKIDARFNREAIALRIEKIASLRKKITVTNEDAKHLIEYTGRQRRKTIIYCDPPYFIKGYQLYRNHYQQADHENFATIVKSLKCPWIVTYDDHPEIERIYQPFTPTKFNLFYSTHLSREKSSELLFHGNIKIPTPPFLHR